MTYEKRLNYAKEIAANEWIIQHSRGEKRKQAEAAVMKIVDSIEDINDMFAIDLMVQEILKEHA